MNKAAVQLDEIEGALLKLKEHNDVIFILIIIPKGGGFDDPGYDIADIANRIGIKRITVKKVEDLPGDF